MQIILIIIACGLNHLIRFQPFSVGMLAVEQGEDTSNVNCWMDIRKGRFPEVRIPNANINTNINESTNRNTIIDTNRNTDIGTITHTNRNTNTKSK